MRFNLEYGEAEGYRLCFTIKPISQDHAAVDHYRFSSSIVVFLKKQATNDRRYSSCFYTSYSNLLRYPFTLFLAFMFILSRIT